MINSLFHFPDNTFMTYINKFNPDAGFDTEERCHINELLNTPEQPECSIAQASVTPGETTQLHAVKDTIERYVILQGKGDVYINNHPAEAVLPGDTVVIPAGAAQKIANTGTEELVFLCVCTPRFEQKNYLKLE